MSQSLIFDMDGTLFQTNKILELSLVGTFDYLRLLGEWDKKTPTEEYREMMGVPLPEVWETLLPHHSNEIRDKANNLFQEKLINNIFKGNGALFPHVEEIFSYLKELDYKIYIASNGQPAYLHAIVDYYRLNNWVTETFSIGQIQSLNKTDLIASIIKKYRIKKGAVVGDRISDIKAAQENGLVAVGCKFDFAKEEELAQADLVIEELNEIKVILSRLKELVDA
ncbi:HAD hydrolase-like protein [Halobacillus naozhouensis]|uniref:HAD hydrolase-like protein n=1 Tax=Halobacillus naozhouensis TaxID=554880 RepID=A0ABY8J224_9BACI|nr:HAD hydrolase-like protein [Halobacillus naozhouensis]WFT76117.1 HAD hydrolase-like protein [Halobacillus naozhouensis]